MWFSDGLVKQFEDMRSFGTVDARVDRAGICPSLVSGICKTQNPGLQLETSWVAIELGSA